MQCYPSFSKTNEENFKKKKKMLGKLDLESLLEEKRK